MSKSDNPNKKERRKYHQIKKGMIESFNNIDEMVEELGDISVKSKMTKKFLKKLREQK